MHLTKEEYDRGFCPTTIYEIHDDPTINDLFKVYIDTSKLIGFVDAAHVNDLTKNTIYYWDYFQFYGRCYCL